MTRSYISHYYGFKRGDTVRIRWGAYAGAGGVVDSAVFQQTVNYLDEQAPGCHVVLDDERIVTVRWNQISGIRNYKL